MQSFRYFSVFALMLSLNLSPLVRAEDHEAANSAAASPAAAEPATEATVETPAVDKKECQHCKEKKCKKGDKKCRKKCATRKKCHTHKKKSG